jgi:hypothetical protein
VASKKEIHAVREVIYDPKRQRELKQQLRSIRVQMRLEGEGPAWVIPSTGESTVAVRDSARRCKQVAALLRRTSDRLVDVDVNRSDKAHLREGFEHLAKAWAKRGAVWGAPQAPDADAQATVIAGFERAAFREWKRVQEYFKEDQGGGGGEPG